MDIMLKIESEAHYDENAFRKADRTSSKLNFLFYSKSKTNLVTFRKFTFTIPFDVAMQFFMITSKM